MSPALQNRPAQRTIVVKLDGKFRVFSLERTGEIMRAIENLKHLDRITLRIAMMDKAVELNKSDPSWEDREATDAIAEINRCVAHDIYQERHVRNKCPIHLEAVQSSHVGSLQMGQHQAQEGSRRCGPRQGLHTSCQADRDRCTGGGEEGIRTRMHDFVQQWITPRQRTSRIRTSKEQSRRGQENSKTLLKPSLSCTKPTAPKARPTSSNA